MSYSYTCSRLTKYVHVFARRWDYDIYHWEGGDELFKVPATWFDTTNIVQSSHCPIIHSFHFFFFFIVHTYRSSFMPWLIEKIVIFKSLQNEVTFDVFLSSSIKKNPPNKTTFRLYIYFVIIWSPYVSLYHYFYSEQFKKSVETDQPKADFTFVVVCIYI